MENSNNSDIPTLITEFSKQSLSSKLLYIDGYNNLRKFYNMDTNLPPDHWDLETPFQNIKRFVQAANKSGWTLKVIVKSDNISEEEKDEWMFRREKEIKTGKKYPPPKCGYLLWSFFNRCGVEVLFSYEASSDDTIAALAELNKASILSGDRDFFKYLDRTYTVYDDFLIDEEGFIKFIEHRNPTMKEEELEMTKILNPPPKTLMKNTAFFHWKNEDKKHLYFGCPSPLSQNYNPYLVIRPLRQAVYHQLGIKEKTEYMVTWDKTKNEASWQITLVTSDDTYLSLLDKPMEAVEEFFKISSLQKPVRMSERTWLNHLYSLYTVVIELCTINSEETERKFFELIQKIPKPKILIDYTSEEIAYNKKCYCGTMFSLTNGEMDYYKKKNFQLPKRCKECRNKNKIGGNGIFRNKKNEEENEEEKNEEKVVKEVKENQKEEEYNGSY